MIYGIGTDVVEVARIANALKKFGDAFAKKILSQEEFVIFKKNNLSFLYYWQETMSIKDPFCDFDLIFSSAYSGTKILEYPVHYRNRKYGTTNISRFRDGWKLILYLLNSLLIFKTSY